MRGMIERIKWKMSIWMQGRYGQDRLSMHLCWIAFVLLLIGSIFGIGILTPVSLVLWVYAIFRICSKQTAKRENELIFYEKTLNRPVKWISLQKRKWAERKTHCYFKCPCGTTLRVPKGKGEIEITCPKCHNKINRKT